MKKDEAATAAQLCETFDIILEATAKDYGHAVRSVHAKSHGILGAILGSLARFTRLGDAHLGRHDIFLRGQHY